jgi:hypothetical protein
MLRCTACAISRPARRASLIRRSNSLMVPGTFGQGGQTPAAPCEMEPGAG